MIYVSFFRKSDFSVFEVSSMFQIRYIWLRVWSFLFCFVLWTFFRLQVLFFLFFGGGEGLVFSLFHFSRLVSYIWKIKELKFEVWIKVSPLSWIRINYVNPFRQNWQTWLIMWILLNVQLIFWLKQSVWSFFPISWRHFLKLICNCCKGSSRLMPTSFILRR